MTNRTRSILVCLLAAGSAHAQTPYPLNWSYQIGTVETDRASSVTVDTVGNVIISGTSDGDLFGAPSPNLDHYLAKYARDGEFLWGLQYGDAFGSAGHVSTDAVGNIYISGTYRPSGPRGDAYLRKYTSGGSFVWERTLDSGGDDLGGLVQVHPDGGVLFGGTTTGSLFGSNNGNFDSFLVYLDGEGNDIWAKQIGTPSAETTNAVAVDGFGNIYLGGSSLGDISGPNQGRHDLFIARYDTAGNEVWLRSYGTDEQELMGSIAVNSEQQLIVASLKGNSSFLQEVDSFVHMVHPDDGEIMWTTDITSTRNDFVTSIGVDPHDSIIVAGYTSGTLAGPPSVDDDLVLGKLDSAGDVLWISQLDSIDGGAENRGVIALDADGNVILMGTSEGDFFGANQGDRDIVLAKFLAVPEPKGSLMWIALTLICLCRLGKRKTHRPIVVRLPHVTARGGV